MRVWKPFTEYEKFRSETGIHGDVALEEGEEIRLTVAGQEIVRKKYPKGEIWKLHVEIVIEPFDEIE